MKAMAPDLERRYHDADAMIADLELFRKNPGVDLDFELSDLRPEENDEPTQALRTAAVRSGAAAVHRQTQPRERRRYDEYDDDPPPRKNKKQTVIIVAAALVAGVLAITLLRSILTSFIGATPQDYPVKNLVGMTVEKARELDGVAGIFEVREVGTEYSEDYGEGLIVRQSPDEGERRKGEGLVIDVWVSAGEDVGKMIDVTNMTVAEAKIALAELREQYDLIIEEPAEADQVYDEEVEAGKIISSSPAKDEPLKKGDTIRMVVSKGAQPIQLPTFVGMQIEKVLEQEAELGLVFKVTDEVNDKPAGTVIDQNPADATEVAPGSTVALTVSKGPENNDGSGMAMDLVTFTLPSNKTEGYLKVYQDNELSFQGMIDCTPGTYVHEVYANGETSIKAYLDDELIYNEVITIDNYND